MLKDDNSPDYSRHHIIEALESLSEYAEGSFSERDTAPTNDGEGDNGDQAADAEFEADGYEFIPGVIKNETGVWETLNKVRETSRRKAVN